MNYKENIKCIEHITKSEEINSFAKIPIICSLLKEIRECSEKDITLDYNNLFQDLLQLMAILRAKCPWDKKQTNDSLLKYAVEEVFELVEAVKNDDNTAFATSEIKGELGDVLLQVIFHAHLYQEQERFDIGEVIYALQEKLIRRTSKLMKMLKNAGMKLKPLKININLNGYCLM